MAYDVPVLFASDLAASAVAFVCAVYAFLVSRAERRRGHLWSAVLATCASVYALASALLWTAEPGTAHRMLVGLERGMVLCMAHAGAVYVQSVTRRPWPKPIQWGSALLGLVLAVLLPTPLVVPMEAHYGELAWLGQPWLLVELTPVAAGIGLWSAGLGLAAVLWLFWWIPDRLTGRVHLLAAVVWVSAGMHDGLGVVGAFTPRLMWMPYGCLVFAGALSVGNLRRHLGRLWASEQSAVRLRAAHSLEAKLAAQHEDLSQSLLQSMGDGVVVVDARASVQVWNPAMATITGIAAEQARGSSLQEVFATAAPGVHSRLAGALEAALRGEVTKMDDVPLRLDDRVLQCTFSPHRVSAGERPTGAVALIRDVTEEQRHEETLRRSEARFRTLAEASPDAILAHWGDSIIYVNPAFLRMLGYSRSDVATLKLPAVLHDEDIEDFEDHLRTTGTGDNPAVELRLRHRDGTAVCVEVVSFPLEFETAPAAVSIARDITERKQLLAKMMELDRMAAVGTLAAGVGHEINNPLSYVIANQVFAVTSLRKATERLADEPLDLPGVRSSLDEARLALADAQQGADRVRVVVADLRQFSRVDEPEQVEIQLVRVLDLAVSMATTELKQRARVVQNYRAAPRVRGDEGRLGQVFLNLLVNAAQAIPAGQAEDHEILIDITTRGEQAVVEIRDDGPGISPEHLDRIFDPFFTTKPAGQGTGLGLAICREIVTGVGGTIDAESTVGIGTVFRVMLPLYTGPSRLAPTLPPTLIHPREERARVLVVDDEVRVAKALERLLSRDYDVVRVSSADEALDAIGAGEMFDAVLCDLLMPRVTGMELYGVISQIQPLLAERFIFVTGGAFTTDAQEFLKTVQNEVVDKPFDPSVVRRAIGKVVHAAP